MLFLAVSSIIGMCDVKILFFNVLQSSMPFFTGIIMSEIMMSGISDTAVSMPMAPLGAVRMRYLSFNDIEI